MKHVAFKLPLGVSEGVITLATAIDEMAKQSSCMNNWNFHLANHVSSLKLFRVCVYMYVCYLLHFVQSSRGENFI